MKLLVFLFICLSINGSELTDARCNQIMHLLGLKDFDIDVYHTWLDLSESEKKKYNKEFGKQYEAKAKAQLKKDYSALFALIPVELKPVNENSVNNSLIKLAKELKEKPFKYPNLLISKFESLGNDDGITKHEYQTLKKGLQKLQPQLNRIYTLAQEENFKYCLEAAIESNALATFRGVAKCYATKIRIALIEKKFDQAVQILEEALQFSAVCRNLDGNIIYGLIALAVESIINESAFNIIWERDIEPDHLKSVLKLFDKHEFKVEFLKPYFVNEFLFASYWNMAFVDSDSEMIKFQIKMLNIFSELKDKKNMTYEKYDKKEMQYLLVELYQRVLKASSASDFSKSTLEEFNDSVIKRMKAKGLYYNALRTIITLPVSVYKKAYHTINKRRCIKLSLYYRLHELKNSSLPELEELLKSGLMKQIPVNALTGKQISFDKESKTIEAEGYVVECKYVLNIKDSSKLEFKKENIETDSDLKDLEEDPFSEDSLLEFDDQKKNPFSDP